MKASVSYQKHLLKDLQDPAEAAAYLNSALDDGDSQILLLALRNVAKAQGGLSKLSQKSKLNRANLYTMFSKSGNPRIQTLEHVLKILGLRLAITPAKHRRRL